MTYLILIENHYYIVQAKDLFSCNGDLEQLVQPIRNSYQVREKDFKIEETNFIDFKITSMNGMAGQFLDINLKTYEMPQIVNIIKLRQPQLSYSHEVINISKTTAFLLCLEKYQFFITNPYLIVVEDGIILHITSVHQPYL